MIFESIDGWAVTLVIVRAPLVVAVPLTAGTHESKPTARSRDAPTKPKALAIRRQGSSSEGSRIELNTSSSWNTELRLIPSGATVNSWRV